MKEKCKRVCCHCAVVDCISLDKNEGRAHTDTHRRAGTGLDDTGTGIILDLEGNI